jgi:hypothetical protein
MSQARVRPSLQNLNCSVASFAALAVPPMVKAKLSQQQMNLIVNGQTELNEGELKQYLAVLDAMQYLQESVTPRVPIDWSNVLHVKETLVATFIKRLDAKDPTITRLVFVRLSRTHFLQGIRSNGSVIETMNYHSEGAAFESYDLAKQAVQALKQMQIDSQPEVMTAPRRRSTITNSLEEIGFKE